MKRSMFEVTATVAILVHVCACSGPLLPDNSVPAEARVAVQSTAVITTNEAGDKMASRPNVRFRAGKPQGIVVTIDPSDRRQRLLGVGSSFTESSAFVLAHLEEHDRRQVMNSIFSEAGANFPIARTPIGSTDFSVEGKYSYAETAGDSALESFSIQPDREGFSRQIYRSVVDESYDLLPMIKEAQAIKAGQTSRDLRIVASAWTAPPWMKTIETWYIPGSAENNWQGTGGDLKPEYVGTYANYLIHYLDAYQDEGVNLWGLTPVNEPHGNSGNWESMHFSPKTQNEFIKRHLGPALESSDHAEVKLLIYDQNRDDLEAWTDVMFADEQTSKYVYGAAVHWYSSTYDVYEDVFERVRDKFPGFALIHTEGTIDDLGKDAPGGVLDPVGFKESGWFLNDEFWWNKNATDWGYTATWAGNADNHPVYTPVHRYARDIVVGFNHGLEGWIDWNIVLDAQGGPNHVGNFCGAPIMIDTNTKEIYYTPIYYVLAQLSRSIRPGDTALMATTELNGLNPDALHASASINASGLLSVQLLNTTKAPLNISVDIGGQYASLALDANSLTTVQVRLP